MKTLYIPLSDGVIGVVGGWAQGQSHASLPKLIGDGAGIRDGAGQAVEFGHDRGIALSHGGQGLVEAGPGAGGAMRPTFLTLSSRH